MQLRVYAILVNYNGYADTIACLHSLKEQVGVDCRPLVIDNASQNNSVANIKTAHPDVEIIQTKRNLGFAGGNNVGIENALAQGCNYLFLVNNDTTMEPNCLQELVACAEKWPDAAVVMPAIYYHGDRSKPWFTGSTANLEDGLFLHDETDLRGDGIRAPFNIPWATGCAMLVSASKMREIGGFDTRFFCYYEDVDWSLRAQQKSGTCVLCPQAILYHIVFGSSAKRSMKIYYYAARNQLLCMDKNTPASQRRARVRHCTARTINNVKRMLTRPLPGEGKRRALAIFLGVADYYLRRFGPCRYSWL